MNKNSRRDILFRYLLISAGIILFAVAIGLQLFSTTVVHAEQWNMKADSVLSRVEVVLPRRGDILAADGSVLATNLRYYTVRMDYRCEKFMEEEFHNSIDALSDSMARFFSEISGLDSSTEAAPEMEVRGVRRSWDTARRMFSRMETRSDWSWIAFFSALSFSFCA